MRLQPTHNLFQGYAIWQEMQKEYHQSRLKRTMTNTLSAVFCSDLALLGKSIRQRERFCLGILQEIQHLEGKRPIRGCIEISGCCM